MGTQVRFKFLNDTKRCFRFQEVDSAGLVIAHADSVVGGLYIKKAFFQGGPHESVTVTLDTP